jgi:hypothetical protein
MACGGSAYIVPGASVACSIVGSSFSRICFAASVKLFAILDFSLVTFIYAN